MPRHLPKDVPRHAMQCRGTASRAVARLWASAVALLCVPWHSLWVQVPWHCFACRGTTCFASAVALHLAPWHDPSRKCRGTASRAVARLIVQVPWHSHRVPWHDLSLQVPWHCIACRGTTYCASAVALLCVPWHDFVCLEGHQLSGGVTPVGVTPLDCGDACRGTTMQT